ncbi:MAG: hypothetical protein FWG64_00525 [Firmicutes bacterium]|nr:hypothetical protein [Bacillota bacterium]
MNDKKQILLEIIQPAMRELLKNPDSYPFYTYVDIPQKYREQLKKVDRKFIFEDFVAAQSFEVFGGLKSDFFIFTVDGFYFVDTFTKNFVKYSDIMGFSQEKDGWLFEGNFCIHHSNGDKFTLVTTLWEKQNGRRVLENLLETLKNQQSATTEVISHRKTGKVDNSLKFTTAETIQANLAIHAAAVGAGLSGAGLAQIPLADAAIITPVQMTMLGSLGGIFGIKVDKNLATAIVAPLAAAFVGRGVSQLAVGWIPVAGNIINASTAVAITEAVGWTAAYYFKDFQQREDEIRSSAYIKASREYEEKLDNQAKKFLEQKKILEDQINEYKSIIEGYEKIIMESNLRGEISKAAETTEKLTKLAAISQE